MRDPGNEVDNQYEDDGATMAEELCYGRLSRKEASLTPGPGIEPGTHWWKTSALTTAPTLQSNGHE